MLPVPPPLQTKLAPLVVLVAVKVTLELLQLSEAGGCMPAFGAVVFWFTLTEAVDVQLLAGLVTVTV